jgi:hypothetical protein
MNWVLASLVLLSSGLTVAIIALLQASGQSALNAVAMILAVVSFGAQLLLAAVGYLAGIRQEERSSVIHRETIEAIQTLRLAIDSNLSATSMLSDRFNAEFQTMLDHVLAASARTAHGPKEAQLLETLGSDLREKALEAAISAPASSRSRLASTVVKVLHESQSTVANSVSYSRGIITWLRDPGSERCTAIVSDALASSEEVRLLARQLSLVYDQASIAGRTKGRYIIFPVRPSAAVLDAGNSDGVMVTSIDQFAAESG